MRDAAYDLLPKRRRADLHVAYADWLLGRDDRGSAADEIVGYHLEQAYEYRSQLGRAGDDRHRELAARASGHLSDAGRRALSAGDRGGASNLLERAVALRTEDRSGSRGAPHRPRRRPPRAGPVPRVGAALREARALAIDAGDGALEARAQVARLLSRLQVDPDAVARLMRRQGDGLERVLEAGGEHGGLAQLWHIRALLWWIKASRERRSGRGGGRADEALLAGDERMFADAVGWEAASMAVGPTRVETAIVRCGEIRAILKNDPWAEALALQPLASLHAMRGEFDYAFSLLDESAATLAGFGPTLDAAVSHPEVFVAVLAGDSRPGRAASRAGRRLLEQMGERAVLASTEAHLAQVAPHGRT